jgi:hypothetical protein
VIDGSGSLIGGSNDAGKFILPCALKRAVKAAPVGEPGELVTASQRVEVLIGDAQFLLAAGELVRHVVEGGRERLEFGKPWLVAGAYMQFGTAEARRGAHQRADRAHDEPLPAEPGDEQNEHPEQCKLHVGDADLAVDAPVHDALVEAHGQSGARPGGADMGEDAPHPVEAGNGGLAFVVPEHLAHQSLAGARPPLIWWKRQTARSMPPSGAAAMR